ncbi:MAG: type II secretion system protein N [Gammaproteobacteria bacterium]
MRRLIILGVVLYALFIARQFPADVVAGWVLPDTVKVYGIRGSIWNGSADAVDPGAADIVLGDTQWTISPWWLLTARAKGTLSTDLSESSRVEAGFSKPFFGSKLHLTDIQGILKLDALPVAMRPNQVNGNVGLSFESLTLDKMWPAAAQGSVDLVNLKVARPRAIDLGSFEIVFDGQSSDPLTGTVSDTRSGLNIDGTLALATDQSYLFEGNALATPEADSAVAEALQFLGPINTDGTVALSFSGTVE